MATAPRLALLFLGHEPVAALARLAERAEAEGFDGFWLAEAPHWFRRLGGDARGAMATLGVVAARTRSLPLGVGIVSPYLRHPTVLAMEAAALDEVSGGRFTLGLGVSRGAVGHLGIDTARATPVAAHRDAITLIRQVLSGRAVEYRGAVFSARLPAAASGASAHRPDLPIYVGATGPRMMELAGAMADGLILPSLTTPPFVRYARERLAAGAARAGRHLDGFPIAAVLVCSVARDGRLARDRVRPMTATYLANKLQNVRNDTILRAAGLTPAELGPLSAALERGATDLTPHVTDEVIRRCSVVAGTPDECAAILGELLAAGVTLPLLEVRGETEEEKAETIRLLAREVRPRLANGLDGRRPAAGWDASA